MRLKQKIYLLLRRHGIVDKHDAYFLVTMYALFMLALFGIAIYQGNATDFLFIPAALSLLIGIAILQVWLKSVFIQFYREYSRPTVAGICLAAFLIWTTIIGFSMKIVGLSNFPANLFLLTIILAPIVYTSYQVIVPWMQRVCEEKSSFVHFFLFHLIVFLLFTFYINKGGIVIDINSKLSLVTYLQLSVLMQIGVYCLFSVGASVRIALYFIFTDQEEECEEI